MSAVLRLLTMALVVASAACSTTTVKTPAQDNISVESGKGEKRDDVADARRRATIRLQLGVSYYQQGKLDVAIDELKQSIKFDPTFADAYNVLGLVYTQLDQTDQADQNFKRGFQLDPANSDLNNNYGWFLCQHGREKESLTYFENALKNPLYTQKARPLQNAGVCAGKVGDAALSEEYFRRSFELDPGGGVAAYNLADIYYRRQDYPRARFYVGQVNAGPESTSASLWLAIRIERRLGNRNNEIALENQLERRFADSREAQMQRRGNYAD
jgi:type IV pilus assembly protein PilF